MNFEVVAYTELKDRVVLYSTDDFNEAIIAKKVLVHVHNNVQDIVLQDRNEFVITLIIIETRS